MAAWVLNFVAEHSVPLHVLHDQTWNNPAPLAVQFPAAPGGAAAHFVIEVVSISFVFATLFCPRAKFLNL